MGPVDHLEITGAKGGDSKPKTPVEAPDSLQSTNIAKILLAVGEGEFDGTPTDRDIYLDNTPIMDASGNVNFPGVKWEWRPGSVEQDYIQGIPSVENETNVNVELRSDNPFTRALSNTQLSAVRVRMTWPRLAQQDSNGNTNGYRIEYAIDIATDGGAYVEAHLGAVDGKTTNGYQRSVRVNLPKASSGWMLRMRRITPNANSGTIADTMTIAGYTEIIDQKLRYPNTALLYIEFDAQQFQNIPAVTVKCKAKRWPVPTNYDPVARTYTGVWDGTFKQAWTNNPAFVTYGLCVEDRFGLGKRIKSWMVDKWEMYRIAQYCDQLVPDGVGGQEPRYLCDMNLQGRSEAWTLLRDLAAIYRGMVYWAHGSLFMQADMPRAQDIDYVFTRANVIEGDFVYGGAERNTHYSRALVSYDNPANNYDTDVIPVTDLSLQRRYRDRPIELSAIGCTRASEAQRRGKWALLSNSQDRTVTFKTGMEGRIPLPGYVIPVADELVAGRPNGGRIASAAGRVVTLDRDTPIKAGDRLILNLPNGTAQARTVQSVAGRAVTVTTDYGVQPEPELQWAIDYDDLAVQLFRVLKTTRTQEGEYEITALEFNPSKFAAIDTGAKLDERPISVIPVTTVQPPASVTLSSTHMIDQGIAVSTMTIAWPAVEGAVAYDVEWRKDNGNWIRLQRTGAASVDVVGIYAGAYLARVRAVSSFDITSIWKSSNLTQLNGKEGLPPAVTFLDTESLLFGIGIKWGFPAGAEDTQRTELWYSEGTDLGLATKLADLAYPQNEHVMQGLRAGQRFFFWARLVDRTGNLGLFFPEAPAVVAGMASADAGAILEQIKDQITESELGQELTSRIDLIDKNGPGSVNDRIGTAKTELTQQISEVNNALNTTKGNLQQQITAVSADVSAAKADLQQQIANVSALAGSLPYRKDKAYSVGQSALGSDGKLYQALKAVPLNTPPPNTTYWTDVGQAVVTANGMAARVQTMETKVETLEGATSAQAQQISGLQSSLTTTNGNVSAAQQAAQDAATLAGGKGKVIVQSAAPAIADRLAQNLWIDTTSNANTPKRWSGTAWVAVTDKVATDAAAAAAAAFALAQTKADATVVSSLTTRVSDAEGKLTSQATRMDGMQTSIDGKASSQALQQVTSRVTATEDKDKAQDQLISSQSQALTSLTDSVSKKAEASAVQSLGNRVDSAEGVLTSQGSDITQLKNSLSAAQSFVAGKAWEFTGSTRGWFGTLSGSTFVAGPLFATAGSCPNLQCNFTPAIAGAENPYLRIRLRRRNTTRAGAQMYWANEDGGLAEARRMPWTINTTTTDWQDIEIDLSGHAGWNGKNILAIRLDMMSASDTTGEIDIAYIAVGRRSIAASAEAVSSLSSAVSDADGKLTSQGGSIVSLQNGLNTTNQGVTAAQQAAQAAATAAGAKGEVIYGAAAPAADKRLAQNLWIDTTGNANTPKRWSGSAWVTVSDKVATDAAAAAQSALTEVAKKADASTVQSLSNTVAQHGQDITAQGQAMTAIDAAIAEVGGENLLYNPTFNRVSAADANVPDGWVLEGSAPRTPSMVPSWLNSGERAFRVAVTGVTNASPYFSLVTQSTQRPRVAGGQSVTTSVNARRMAEAGLLALRIIYQWINEAGTVISAPANGFMPITVEGSRHSFTAVAPEGAVRFNVYFRVHSQTAAAVNGTLELARPQAEYGSRATGWRDNGQVAAGEIAANVSATNLLSGRVEQTEQGLVSHGQSIISLQGGLNTTNQGVTAAQQAAQAAAAAAGAKGEVIYGSTAPATDKRLAQNLWIDTTGNANTPKRWNGSAWVAVTDKVATDAAAAAANALAVAQSKADALAVQSLSTKVSDNEGKLTTQGQAITGLQNSLTTTNGNVTAAQQAAQAASDAAGTKGKVLYQSTAPAVADRISQNLWIDTTGNANTPKRWNGSTWVAVTDKVATDAAAAAAAASALAATKADASAVSLLSNRVGTAEGVLTSNSSDITQLKNSIGTAQPFVAGKSWEFIGSTQGWVGTIAGSTFTAGPLFATAGKCPNLQCNFTPAIAGAENPYLRIRLRRRNTTRAGAQMYWANEDGGLAEARRMAWTISLTTDDWQDIEFDLSGHAGWNGKSIIAIRLDMMNSVDASGEIDIAYIAVGRRSAAASAQAVASLESNVTQQGGKLTAEGLRIDGLYASVGDADAAIQNEAKARADADGALSQQIQTTQSSLGATNASVQQISTAQTGLNNRVNAQFSIKVAVTQSGVYALGGIGVGIQNQNGVLQSVVAVLADQFAVINAAGNGYVSPFAIQGGQVFMNDAFIRDGSIINAKIANGAITSAKIGVAEIDTLRIRGNAVTVPVSANSPGNVLGAGVGQWQNLVAVGVQMDEGGFITAQYSCYQGFGSGIRKYQFQMDINGLVIAEGGGDWADGFPNLMGSIGVGPGFFVVTVKWWGENTGVGVRNHNLFAMGTKR
ncbi:phage tail protein [Pseudomonas juntendi]|uniref:Phage tail protein n=1 Tax=Pseudomonas juntendi TaxID=2666183 RepID=A0A7W2QV01_9PSED|nr:phage tail protein [Pseudomonas juntendi]MBA6143817.1 phage tail protein [Pseudomonas juntendi]